MSLSDKRGQTEWERFRAVLVLSPSGDPNEDGNLARSVCSRSVRPKGATHMAYRFADGTPVFWGVKP